jgi:hypothetical protein
VAFFQEKATLHIARNSTRIGEPLSPTKIGKKRLFYLTVVTVSLTQKNKLRIC